MTEILENFFDFEVLNRSWNLLRIGLINTGKLVALAFFIAVSLGLLVAYGRTHSRSAVRRATIVAIDVVRSLPPLVTLMLVTFLFPAAAGFSISSFHSAVITFGLIHAAYIGEIYRGGIVAIEKGQIEAARAIGLSPWQAARRVLIPQVMRVIVPPLTNEATFVVRNSSLALFIGYPELLMQAKQAVTLTASPTPITAAAVIYAAMLLLMQGVSTFLERRMYSEAVETAPRTRRFKAIPTRRPAEVDQSSE